MLNGTPNESDLHSVYNGKGFIGIKTPLQDVYLAIYDTNAQPFVYTGSENIDITNNRISLNSPITINNDIVLNPRAYEGAVFEMISGTDNSSFLQNTIHGGQPIVQFHASTEACIFHGDCEIPRMYNKTSVDILTADIYSDTCIKTEIDTLTSNIDRSTYYIRTDIDTLISNIDLSSYHIKSEIDTLFSNIDLSSYYTKPEVDDIDNELPTLTLNTYANFHYNILHLKISGSRFEKENAL